MRPLLTANDRAPTGVNGPDAFIVPGYAVTQFPGTPEEVQQALSGYHGLNACFIWNSTALFENNYTPAEYAQAIIDGLTQE